MPQSPLRVVVRASAIPLWRSFDLKFSLLDLRAKRRAFRFNILPAPAMGPNMPPVAGEFLHPICKGSIGQGIEVGGAYRMRLSLPPTPMR